VPLETEVDKLVNEYDKLGGAMMVNFDGREQTIQQMVRYLELPERATREQAWRATTERWMRDRDAVEDIFDSTLRLRNQMAANASLPDYRALTWKRTKRFDYTPDDCQRFADSVAATVVPLVRELNRARAERLGLEHLRPWDLSVDPQNRRRCDPLRNRTSTASSRALTRSSSACRRRWPMISIHCGGTKTSTSPAARASSRADTRRSWTSCGSPSSS